MALTFISICNQPPPWSTQLGHPFIGKRNKYQPKGSDALQLGSKGRYGSCVGGMNNCDPLVTHKPYLSTLEIKGLYIKCHVNSSIYILLYFYKAL